LNQERDAFFVVSSGDVTYLLTCDGKQWEDDVINLTGVDPATQHEAQPLAIFPAGNFISGTQSSDRPL
jgi:hypothetical protein